jgi:hypothetical protein
VSVSKLKGCVVANHGLGLDRTAIGTVGYPCVFYQERYYHPLAEDVDYIVDEVAAPSGAGGLDGTLLHTTLDFPRNVTITSDGAQTSTCKIDGTDQYGKAQTETLTFNGAATVVGNHVFATISKAHFSQRSGAANVSVGIGSKLGLHRIANQMFIRGTVDGAVEATVPVADPGTSHDSVVFNTALDPAKVYRVLYTSDEEK